MNAKSDSLPYNRVNAKSDSLLYNKSECEYLDSLYSVYSLHKCIVSLNVLLLYAVYVERVY